METLTKKITRPIETHPSIIPSIHPSYQPPTNHQPTNHRTCCSKMHVATQNEILFGLVMSSVTLMANVCSLGLLHAWPNSSLPVRRMQKGQNIHNAKSKFYKKKKKKKKRTNERTKR
jgi:hypothetical protein